MILKGYEDLRVIKTIEAINKAFESLICEKNYDKITVKELCDRAKINKKTFYKYYETLDFLLAEMQKKLSTEYIDRIKQYSLPEELDKVNREFFIYSSNKGLAYEKITCSRAYNSIRNDMISEVNEIGWGKSEQYQKLSDYEKKILMKFINNTVLTAYSQWIEDEKKIPLEEVISLTNSIVIGGVKDFFKHCEKNK